MIPCLLFILVWKIPDGMLSIVIYCYVWWCWSFAAHSLTMSEIHRRWVVHSIMLLTAINDANHWFIIYEMTDGEFSVVRCCWESWYYPLFALFLKLQGGEIAIVRWDDNDQFYSIFHSCLKITEGKFFIVKCCCKLLSNYAQNCISTLDCCSWFTGSELFIVRYSWYWCIMLINHYTFFILVYKSQRVSWWCEMLLKVIILIIPCPFFPMAWNHRWWVVYYWK